MTAVGGLVHARMTSERLPGKPLEEICGRAAILHIVDRMLACSYLALDRIVVCTTTDPRDDRLADAVAAAEARVFRGSTHDVVDRLYSAAAAHGFDAVVQVDGDDLCADPGYMDRVLETLLSGPELDVVLVKGLPLGLATKAIRFSALERVHDAYLPGDNSTGVFSYFTRSGLCRVGEIQAAPEHRLDAARLTLDEPEDLELFRQVFAALHRPGSVFAVEEIVALLTERPELVSINAGLTGAYYTRSDEHIRRERLRFRTPEGIREVEAA